MSSNHDNPDQIWLVQTLGAEGLGLWMVGSDTSSEAADMVRRNIGAMVLGLRRTPNTRFVAFGELRMARDGATLEEDGAG